jgi:hypothetical protein
MGLRNVSQFDRVLDRDMNGRRMRAKIEKYVRNLRVELTHRPKENRDGEMVPVIKVMRNLIWESAREYTFDMEEKGPTTVEVRSVILSPSLCFN